jgi:hypothetical protein
MHDVFQDLIESDDTPLWRLLAITLHLMAMRVRVALNPHLADKTSLSQA